MVVDLLNSPQLIKVIKERIGWGSRKMFAENVGMRYNTLNHKINGYLPFNEKEAFSIMLHLNLFKEPVDE